MDDASCSCRSLLYARLSLVDGSDPVNELTGLFTRPPHLALADEAKDGMPVKLLNRACDALRNAGAADGRWPSIDIEEFALEQGFRHVEAFIELFEAATSWHPEDWMRKFGWKQSAARNW